MFEVLDLFSGVGGFSLGLERTNGFKTVAFCEIEKFPQKILRKHWSHVPIYDDVRTLTAEQLRADGISVDVICGGFPCQDISTAGSGIGIEGKRSGLWSEYARIIGGLRPRYVIVENVSALLGRGLYRVLGDLATLGYDAEWHCIPACAVGAPHRRDRIWIVAYPNQDGTVGERRNGDCGYEFGHSASEIQERQDKFARTFGSSSAIMADADSERKSQSEGSKQDKRRRSFHGSKDVSDTASQRQSGSWQSGVSGCSAPLIDWKTIESFAISVRDFWSVEPNVGRVANGVSSRMDRLGALGNAVVPQIPELIGRSILQATSS